GSITGRKEIPNPEELMGLPVSRAKTYFPYTAGIPLLLCMFSGGLFLMFKPAVLPTAEKEARRAKKKYRGLIADVSEPPDDAENVIVSVASMADLAIIAQGLLKPILHEVESDRHVYSVIDDLMRYRYVSY
ncbi:MAG: DUF5305 family protein, partial [Chloroflexota bacterium]